MLDLMKQRRSIRQYESTPIPEDLLQKILSAALLAPSGMNKKPVQFVVVNDPSTLSKLKACKTSGTTPLNTAPTAIIVIADTINSVTWIEDASIAATCIQLAAEALGISSCWIQMRGRQSQTGESENEIRSLLNIPNHMGVLAVLTLGYKDEIKPGYTANDVDFSKVHLNKF